MADKTDNVLLVRTGNSARSILDPFVTRKRRIEPMLSLPLTSLDKLAIRCEIRDIGKR